jgi:hypothetical protein
LAQRLPAHLTEGMSALSNVLVEKIDVDTALGCTLFCRFPGAPSKHTSARIEDGSCWIFPGRSNMVILFVRFPLPVAAWPIGKQGLPCGCRIKKLTSKSCSRYCCLSKCTRTEHKWSMYMHGLKHKMA